MDYESDVRISDDILNQVSEVYRKIRNTMRFMLANTTDFDPKAHVVAFEDLRTVDQYMLVRFNQLVDSIRKAYDNYQFSTVYQGGYQLLYCLTYHKFYLDFAKDVVLY